MKKPIRMKGYWRAVRAKKSWALRLHKLGEGTIQWMLAFIYDEGALKNLTYKENPFLLMIPKKNLTDEYKPVIIDTTFNKEKK